MEKDQKRILVMSGGGFKCAYHAGFLKYIQEQGIKYDLVLGTSGGALVAAAMVEDPEKYGDNAVKYFSVKDLIGILPDNQVTIKFPPVIRGIFGNGILNNETGRKIFQSIDMTKGPDIIVNAVSVETGHRRLFRKGEPDFIPGLMGSSAFPVLFPAEEIDGEHYIDGGVRDNRLLTVAVAEAKKRGIKQIDVVDCSYDPKGQSKPNKWFSWSPLISVVASLLRFVQDETARMDLIAGHVLAQKAGVNVNFYFNSEQLGSTWDARRKTRLANIEMGYNDAKAKFDKVNEFDKVILAWDERLGEDISKIINMDIDSDGDKESDS